MITIRNARAQEYPQVGELLFEVYSKLEGFPKPEDSPEYFKMLSHVHRLLSKPGTEILVASGVDDKLLGAVVYFDEIKYYGSGGTATQEINAAGFRFLAVAEAARGQGVGKLLTLKCIDKARERARKTVVIHTTMAMKNAWAMYERLGFQRAPDLDFMEKDLAVFGFRYNVEAMEQ